MLQLKILQRRKRRSSFQKCFQVWQKEIILGSEQLNEMSSRLYRTKKLLPDSFIIKLISARIDTMRGSYNEALTFYKEETEPLHRSWSRFVIDHAITLQASGDFRKALALITAFHSLRQQGSLESLIIQRNLFLAVNDAEQAHKVQKFLMATFPENNELKLQNVYLKVQRGMLVEAEAD